MSTDAARRNAGVRFIALGALLTLELLAASIWLDTEVLASRPGLLGIVGMWGPELALALVASVTVLIGLAITTTKSHVDHLSAAAADAPVSWRLLTGHVVTLSVWVGVSQWLFGSLSLGQHTNLITATWLVLGGAAVLFAALAFLPFRFWVSFGRATRTVWIYAAVAAIVSRLLTSSADALWRPSSDLAFALVRTSLRPFVPDLIADPMTFKIRSDRFSVIISKECSGLEGAGLMLVFAGLWLWFLRREYRFPRALLLIPTGVLVIWFANILRLDLLFLIGHWGWRKVAAGGFHSQAGWIAFNAIALGFSVVSRRTRWLTKECVEESLADGAESPPTARYLIPLLALLAAGMLARAVSAGFEWLYPLRVIVVAAALWHFRSRYRDLDWRAGWLAPLAGLVVFGLWVALDRLAESSPTDGIAASLASLPAPARLGWLLFRTLGAIVTVPIAEELAFRGYLMRRLTASDFATLSLTRVSLAAVLVSSAVFGILHGGRPVAGTIAGVVYAGAAMWRGRIGDAVVAHATTNALIATTVLVGGLWQLW